ncbi:putative orfan [Tupanvirus soda lake]|uniref:Orfan n=2 Tax=Tupanvirus TaxID=2094720 RepID=A0AC62ADH6_9VIRU|nr:putative orfan [Tupanvirus soda lake]QKU35845.1 putative orfan [Tupanvirus soda lake]
MNSDPKFTDIIVSFKNFGLWFISFDPTDADGYKTLTLQYKIFESLQIHNKQFFIFASSKACPTQEMRVSTPEQTECYSPLEEQKELACASKMLYKLAPQAIIVVGSYHINSPVPLKFIKNAHEVYGNLVCVEDDSLPIISLESCSSVIKKILNESPCGIFMDFFGCVGYFPKLTELVGEELIAKGLSNTIIPVMGGILEECPPQTLALPGRHPFSTMNQLYDKTATNYFIDFCKKHNIQLFYCTNTKCNEFAKFSNDKEMNSCENMSGLLANITSAWFGPHLKDKYVDFDTFTFCSYVLYLLGSNEVQIDKRFLHLYDNPAIHLLCKDSDPKSLPNVHTVNSDYLSVNKTSKIWILLIRTILDQV